MDLNVELRDSQLMIQKDGYRIGDGVNVPVEAISKQRSQGIDVEERTHTYRNSSDFAVRPGQAALDCSRAGIYPPRLPG
ncbi:hypothetical protein OS493_027961 [Desmophyllum pertusum]|uniref:Uncharacterized protein n=1 Tax=Desmophyllum pertusum TaxID=174260 RepID=A0A9W9Y9E8_9CNID|nr:hypothetical protein OS493_027961 [Desmophyllum pertusum]